MNKKLTSIIIFIILIVTVVLVKQLIFSSDPDVIDNYIILAEPRKDGSVDFTYEIDWKVLDSSDLGPLTWIEVGVPNSTVNNATSLSSSISSISKKSINGQSLVRIDLTDSYSTGQSFKVKFKFNCQNLYTKDSSSYYVFNYTPGWFNDIEVKNASVTWKNDDNIYTTNANTVGVDGYNWQKHLNKGEKLKCTIKYYPNSFTGKYENTYSSSDDYTPHYTPRNTGATATTYGAITVIVIFFVFIYIICLAVSASSYSSNRGFYSSRPYYGYHHHSRGFSHHSSCVHSRSCACACACAGGGRAGCSKKDFFGTKLSSKKIIEKL